MERHQQILDVACRLFVARGYASVSIDEIGRAAGVSGPAIYRHFGAKTEILSLLCNQAVDRLIEFVGPSRPDPTEELAALVFGQAKLVATYPALVQVYENDERSLPETARKQVRRRQRDHVKRWVAALAALRPDVDASDLEVLAFGAIGMLLSASRWPRSVRAHPALTKMLVTAAHNSMAAQPGDHKSLRRVGIKR